MMNAIAIAKSDRRLVGFKLVAALALTVSVSWPEALLVPSFWPRPTRRSMDVPDS
jgi:hypothetical protein